MTACDSCRAEVVAELRALLEDASLEARRKADAARRRKDTRTNADVLDRRASGYARASGLIRRHEQQRTQGADQ